MSYRYANSVSGDYMQKRIEKASFSGYVCNIKIKGLEKPLIVNNGIDNVCIQDEKYEWIEVYPDNANYAITIMFDADNKLVEWYFDIAKKVGVDNGIPFEDDLYLDMVITPNGQKIVLDEDELLRAFENREITQSDVDNAYQTLNFLEKRYYLNLDFLKELTNDFWTIFHDKNEYWH